MYELPYPPPAMVFFFGIITHERNQTKGGVVAKVLDCDIVISKLEFQSSYYAHSEIKTLGKGINSLVSPPAMD